MSDIRQAGRSSDDSRDDRSLSRSRGRTRRSLNQRRTGNNRRTKRTRTNSDKAKDSATQAPKIGDTLPASASKSQSALGTASRQSDTTGTSQRRSTRRRDNRNTRRRDNRRGHRTNQNNKKRSGQNVRKALPVKNFRKSSKNNPSKKGRHKRGQRSQPLGRYRMYVHVGDWVTHIAVLEGRRLIDYFVSRHADTSTEIHGNIYLGHVQNVLPGMETAFVDIGTPKNAVLYRGDVRYDLEDFPDATVDNKPRIEDVIKSGQSVLCQVSKNPIGHKGARLVQEISLAGRCVVLIPNSSVLGVSKRLPKQKARQLKAVLELIQPEGFGLILRTAAESSIVSEIESDVNQLMRKWRDIERRAQTSEPPALLHKEPEVALRLIREECSSEFRNITIDDYDLYEQISDYMTATIPSLANRVEYYDVAEQKLPLLERYCVVEQLYKALNPKVWLPSGGSIIIEQTEALTVVDVNTSRNVGKSNLKETVLENNLEAAEELARQLRLRDIGGIIVVDFVDMEASNHRQKVVKRFKDVLARDKTRTQVLDISSLGLLEMTRKRVGNGLLDSLSDICEPCSGHGRQLIKDMLK